LQLAQTLDLLLKINKLKRTSAMKKLILATTLILVGAQSAAAFSVNDLRQAFIPARGGVQSGSTATPFGTAPGSGMSGSTQERRLETIGSPKPVAVSMPSPFQPEPSLSQERAPAASFSSNQEAMTMQASTPTTEPLDFVSQALQAYGQPHQKISYESALDWVRMTLAEYR